MSWGVKKKRGGKGPRFENCYLGVGRSKEPTCSRKKIAHQKKSAPGNESQRRMEEGKQGQEVGGKRGRLQLESRRGLADEKTSQRGEKDENSRW